jgi:hypothetical protein
VAQPLGAPGELTVDFDHARISAFGQWSRRLAARRYQGSDSHQVSDAYQVSDIQKEIRSLAEVRT